MSNPQTYYITNTGSGQFQDLSSIFQPLSGGTPYPIETGFKFMLSGVETDLNQIFLPLSSGTPLGYNVNFISDTSGNLDLSQIFAKFVYSISNESYNMNVTTINYGGYTALIFENTVVPATPSPINATCNISFAPGLTINTLIVGAGGGGGGGNEGYVAGGGGGGGGYIYTTFTNSSNSAYSIQVAGGGNGCPNTDGSSGNSNGFYGGDSFISLGSFILDASSGQPGYGIGATEGYTGGQGGNATNSLNNTGGGGGGGGGGAFAQSASYSGIVYSNPTQGSLNSSYNSGNIGGSGDANTYPYYGGNGGIAYSNYITPPFLSSGSIYYGNGGGGGSLSTGGRAGSTNGGAGEGSSSTNGQNSTYGLNSGNYFYGNGGGGGSQTSVPSGNTGGYGGNGVVILWWLN